MPVFNVSIAVADSYTLQALAEKVGVANTDKHQLASNLINLIQSMSAGGTIGKLVVQSTPSANTSKGFARMEVTYADIVADTSNFHMGPMTLSCVSANPDASQFEFLAGATATTCAANIATLINASAFGSYMTAVGTAAVLGVATVEFTLTSFGSSLISFADGVDTAFQFTTQTWDSNSSFDTSVTPYSVEARFGL